MPNICDYSVARPDPNHLAAFGIGGVVRYCVDGSGPAGKAIAKAEYDALLAAGLEVALVMEVCPQPAMRGPAGGTADAIAAEQAAKAIGYPPDAVIYYVAEDPTRLGQQEWPTVVGYFKAVKALNPARKLGAYGSQQLVAYLQQQGLVTFGWMVGPWSSVVDGMHLSQELTAPPAPFVGQIDIDVVLQPDWGQAPRPTPPPTPTPPPQPQGEAEMFVAKASGNASGPPQPVVEPGTYYLVYANGTKYEIETPSDISALQARLGPAAPLTCSFLANMPLAD